MITTGKISTAAIAIFEATAGLRRALVVIEQFANAAQISKQATRVTDLSSSVLQVQLADGHLRGAVQKATVPSTSAHAAAPHRNAEENGTAPSGITANAPTLASRNRPGIDALSVKAPWDFATAFSLLNKILNLDRGPNANDTRPGKGDSERTPAKLTLGEAYARFLSSLSALEGASIAAFTPTLIRALDGIASGLDRLARVARNHSVISAAIVGIPATALALIGLGGAHRFFLRTLRLRFLVGLRDVLWLLRKLGVTSALRWLNWLVTGLTEFADIFAGIEFGSLLLVEGVITAAAGLAVARYELYRHWDPAKRLLSRSIESAHKALANLMKWMADKTRNAAALTSNSIASITATLLNAPHLLTDAAPAMRGLNNSRAVERAAAGARPARLRAIRQAAAAAAFATPLMLATAPAGAFAPPLVSTSDTARIAATLSTTRMTQGAIVINYALNVTIHSEGAADTAALKRGVLEILERHGRELHQTLTREVVRQQRRDFQPRYSHEQR